MEQFSKLTTGKAAFVAGVAILIMVVTVPIAEFGIFPYLFSQDPGKTAQQLASHKTLFVVGVFLNFITIVCDVVAAWALYIFFAPANRIISLLTAWFRLLFASLYLIALANLLQIVSLLNNLDLFQSMENEQVFDLILHHFYSFELQWSFALLLFGIYLGLLGFLALQSRYVPNLLGLLLGIGGAGYLINSAGKLLFPSINTEFLTITFLGELVFMLWLLIKGRKIKTNSDAFVSA